MRLSKKTRSRLLVLNACMWFVCGITVLALLGGPRGAIERFVVPIGEELGGWSALALSAAGIDRDPLPAYALLVEPDVLRAATLLDREPHAASRSDGDRWWFPARFRTSEAIYRVDVQWVRSGAVVAPERESSWRVRFRGDDRYRGMRELSLAPASPERHGVEIVMRDRAAAAGLLTPPAGFATLRLNGSDAVPVFWSEGDSPAMLDRLGYPKGEILSPRGGSAVPAGLAGDGGGVASFAHYEPTIGSKRRASIAEERLERMLALTLNANDAEFRAQIPELLDVEKYLTWNALLWIFDDPDRRLASESSWYFDPVTGLFEPVIRNTVAAEAGAASRSLLTTTHAARLAARILDAPAYRARRNEILWDLVGREGGALVAESDRALGEALASLARLPGSLWHLADLSDAASFRRTSRDALRRRVSSLSTALAATQVETTPVLSVEDETPKLTLTVEPTGLATIALDEIRFELGEATVRNADAAELRVLSPDGAAQDAESVAPIVLGSSVALRPTAAAIESIKPGASASGRPVWTVEMRLPFFSKETWVEPQNLRSIEVVYRNAITGESLPPARLLTAEALAKHPAGDFFAIFRSAEDLVARSEIPLEVRGDVVALPAGDHRLERTLVIPRSHVLRLDPGVTLRLAPDVSIIAFRGIHAEGTAARPIRVLAADPSRPWGTLAVTRSAEPSRLAFVTVSGGSRAEFQGIEFDGQLSFNASDVVVEDSEIYRSHDADGLSVKRAHFEVRRTQFVGNESDGIGAEWSSGRVAESLFVDNGDDGIDLADSEVDIDDCAFHWMGDKSITAGERSRVRVAATHLSDSEIAIASKEDSHVDVRDSEFRRNRLGFSLYRSKPVFGGGSGSVTGGVFARNERDFAVEPGSNLRLDRVHRESAPASGELIGALALRPVVTRSR